MGLRKLAPPLIETLAAAPGTDLSNLIAGDSFQLQTLFTSTDPGEHFTGAIDSHLFATGLIQFGDPNPQLEIVSGTITQTSSDLSLTPEIVTWDITTLGPGSDEFWNGWSDCNLAAGPTGCAVTNLGVFHPEDSNHLMFDVLRAPVTPVPEPGMLALAGMSFLGAGLLLISRRRHFTL